MMPILSIKHLDVRYQQTVSKAIKNVNLDIYPNTINAIVGPNGSGKSTLIKAILGLIPSAGEILFDNQPLELFRHDLGYVPQHQQVNLSMPITVSEFLSLSHSPCSSGHCEVDFQKQLINELNLSHLTHKQMSSLSGGQFQRVLLVRSLIHEPKLLLLDEPEAGIDLGGETALYQLLKDRVTHHDLTVLVASHEIDSVKRFANQVFVINRELISSGKPEDILTNQTLNTLYHTH